MSDDVDRIRREHERCTGLATGSCDQCVLLDELDDLRRWEAIGRDLAECAQSPNAHDYCWLCDIWHAEADGHGPDCPWRRAVELMSTQPGEDNDGE